MKDYEDAYGHEMLDCLNGKQASEIVEREDGFFDVSSSLGGARYYFADYKDWHTREKLALRYARGNTIDIGCGAGRVSLYLQKKGLEVLGVDISPLAIRVCKLRGLRKARVIPITKLEPSVGTFDTIVMFGNNFGLFGNPKRAKWLLKRFYNMTADNGRIIAESIDPYKTKDPAHLRYQALNRKRRRLPGQLRIRVRYRNYATPWFQYLIVSKAEMRKILEGTGWTIRRTFESRNGPYTAVIEKVKQS